MNMRWMKRLAMLLSLCLLAAMVPAVTAEEEEEIIFALPVDEIVEEAEPVEIPKEEPGEAEEMFIEVPEESAEEAALTVEGSVPIDEEHFPDGSFRAYIAENFDNNPADGVLSESEREAVTEIIVRNMGINSLKGIEVFSSLYELQCDNNNLNSLDVSQNTNMDVLTCSYNPLTALDVSENRKLGGLNCDGTALTSLNISNNPEISELSCVVEGLTNLDISNCPLLIRAAKSNPEISGNVVSWLEDDFPVFSVHTATTVIANGNTLYAGTSSSLDNGISIDGNHFPDDDFLDFISANYDTNGDGVLSESEIAAVTEIDISRTYIWSVSGIRYFTNLRKFSDSYELRELDVRGCMALETISCSSHSLTTINAQGCLALKCIDCWCSHLTNLNVSGCTALTEVYCPNNQLTNLNVSGCEALDSLICYNNQLTNLNVSGCTAMTMLYCDGNFLTSLDVSSCTALTDLACYNNQLTSLDVSECAALTYLSCGHNQLTNLDVSGCAALEVLYCYENKLDSLNISSNPELTCLCCGSNQLISLDVRKNAKLDYLTCWGNQFSILDITNCPILIDTVKTVEPRLFDELDGGGEAVEFEGDKGYIWMDTFLVLTANGETLYPVSTPTPTPTPAPTAEAVPIKNCKIAAIKNQTYTGKALKPAPVVKYNGVKLKKGTDYTVAYSNNKKIGLATVTIKGKGNYTGTKKVTFKIIPKKVTLSKLTAGKKQLTVQWKKGAGNITGYEIQYSLKKNMSGAKTVTVKKAKTVKTTIKKLKSKKTYYVRIRAYAKVSGKKYVSAWSKVLSKKVK